MNIFYKIGSAVIFGIIIVTSALYFYQTKESAYSDVRPNVPEVPDLIKLRINSMTLDQKVGQMFLVGIYTDNSVEMLKELITQKYIGSVILMGSTIKNRSVRDVTDELQNVASSTGQLPLLVGVDQEGGVVSRIQDADSDLTGQPAIHDVDQAYNVAFARGKELSMKGVNVNFSPVLEYITDPTSFLYARVFRGSKEDVVSFGAQMVRGYQDAGIASTIKHFPGHENISVNSHTDLPISAIDRENFADHADVFKQVIEKGDPMLVMTAHVFFPKIDSTYPATLSPTFIEILRTQDNFEGVIITDDMNMGAITKKFGVEEAAVQAVKAGNDILLYVAPSDTINRAYSAVLSSVRNGDISEQRIYESVYRILKTKSRLGE
ncbi:MAG: glycoside hydrolase family 3 N-terminal domain-containing protein [Patescibacteria group bacterium]